MVTEEGKALLLLCHTSYLWEVVHNRQRDGSPTIHPLQESPPFPLVIIYSDGHPYPADHGTEHGH
jgi:hypothetical protein